MSSMRYLRHNHSGRKRAVFDLDAIIADLHSPWLAWYNQESGDNLTVADIKTYKMTDVVKPEFGNRIYDFFRPVSRYGSIPIYDGAAEGLLELHNNGIDIIIATATAGETAAQKYVLAKKAAPWLHRDHILIGARKEAVHGDFFIDDAPKNVLSYKAEWPDTHLLTIGYPYNADLVKKVDLFAQSCFDTKAAWKQIVNYILEKDPRTSDDLIKLASEVEMWKRRAAQHGCNVVDGDHECG